VSVRLPEKTVAGITGVFPSSRLTHPLARMRLVTVPEDHASCEARRDRTQETPMTTLNGTVKRLVSDKGFGFVAAADGSEYFFHQSGCAEFASLREGQAVTFQAGQGPKGPRAENVKTA
jgi:CspA family cold shock protein